MGGGSSAQRAEEESQNGNFHGASPGANRNFEVPDEGTTNERSPVGTPTSAQTGQQSGVSDQDWNTDADTTTWAFELIPFYDENDSDTVENLQQVVATIHIDSRDDFGNTKLMMAVHHNKLGLVKWAIAQGADVNAVNFAGVCALHICCHESNVSHELVEELLEHDASTEIPDANGCTVLHYAASAGDAELVHLLLQYNAKVLAADNQGFTAIEYAFESQDERCTSMLLDADERQRFASEKDKNSVPEARTVDVAQQGDWIEYIDHMSGHAYYHNTKTKETRWEKPHGFGMSVAGASQELTGHSIGDKKEKKSKKAKKEKKSKKEKKKKKKKKKKAKDKDIDNLDGKNESNDLENAKDEAIQAVKQATAKSDGSDDASSDDSDDDAGQIARDTTSGSDGNAAVDSKSDRLRRNMQNWKRLAWKEGIKRVAKRKRREALKAAREHMLQQQQETMRRMEQEHAARMEELKRQAAKEVEEKMMELKLKQSDEAKLLAAEAEKHKAEKEKK